MRLARFALLTLLAPLLAHAQEAPKLTEVLVLASAATEITRTDLRKSLEILNLGPHPIYCAFTSAGAVVNKARRIPYGASWSLPLSWTQKVYCIAASADQVTGAATVVSETLSSEGGAASIPDVVRLDHPNRFRCTVAVSTATTLTAVGGSCAAPGASLSLYITDILFASNAQGIASDTFPTLKYGTGGACGTGTVIFWGAFLAAAVQDTAIQSLAIPIKIPANNEICWINSTAGSKFLVISGYIAP